MVHLPRVNYVKGSTTGNLQELVFANARAGYALLRTGTQSDLYVTLNGANSWHREVIASNATILHLVATPSEIYAIIAQCSKANVCRHYRLARSALTASTWMTSILPAPSPDSGIGVGAYGPNVWVSEQSRMAALLFTSHDQGRTFTHSSARGLVSINGCDLSATSSSTLWAQCPTGMMVSFLHSRDGGAHWTAVAGREFAGTGGGSFDPVSGTLAYIGYGDVSPAGAKNLFRVTNGGRTATAEGRLKCSNLNGLIFTDVSDGLAACVQTATPDSTVLLGTSDGGATWKKVTSFYDRF
jgi:hypothetical protein